MATAPQPPAGEPTGRHPLPERHDDGHDNRVLYAVVSIVVVVLVVIGVFAFDQAEDNDAAKRKAAQLEAVFAHVGVRDPPSAKVLVRSLGDDGGAVCQTSGEDLTKAILDQQISVGGGGVGARPIVIDKDVLNAELAIVSVYCPDRIDAFREQFQGYELDDVFRD